MEWLQTLLDNSSTPVWTAFLLGILTAISPCPLATNIAAIGYISKNISDRKRIFVNGILYTAGRIIAYTLLGAILLTIIRKGAGMFGIQNFIATYGELILGPVLLLAGLYMLFGNRLKMGKFGFSGNGEKLATGSSLGTFLLGVLFAMAFCPTSGVFYFGVLIPLSAGTAGGYLLPAVFATATALPVLAVAWILAFSMEKIGSFYGTMKTVQKWMNIVVGILFTGIGIYYCSILFL